MESIRVDGGAEELLFSSVRRQINASDFFFDLSRTKVLRGIGACHMVMLNIFYLLLSFPLCSLFPFPSFLLSRVDCASRVERLFLKRIDG